MKLLILSDLHGSRELDWLKAYTNPLSDKFDIHFYDSCVLGSIRSEVNDMRDIHHQFIKGGIDNAVAQLSVLERERVSVLGFSVGGLIGWRAALSGLNIDHLVTVSSTRLRYESDKPAINYDLFFGEHDPFTPAEDWFDQMNIPKHIIPNEIHECYKKSAVAQRICKLFL